MRPLALAAVLLVVAVPAAVAHAAPAAPLVLPATHADYQDPVEQQSPNWFYNQACKYDATDPVCVPDSWVHNPYRGSCTWDVDDLQVFQATLDLGAGQSATATACNVADSHDLVGGYGGDPKRIDANVHASVATLTVTLSSSTGLVYSIPAVKQANNSFDYLLCSVTDDTDSAGAVVPGSNGGKGVRVYWRLTVTAAKGAHNVFAVLQTGGFIVQPWHICPLEVAA